AKSILLLPISACSLTHDFTRRSQRAPSSFFCYRSLHARSRTTSREGRKGRQAHSFATDLCTLAHARLHANAAKDAKSILFLPISVEPRVLCARSAVAHE